MTGVPSEADVMAMIARRRELLHERSHPGGDYVLDQPDGVPALWGDGERVLMAAGEAMMLAGQQGAGKTTVAQQLGLHLAGVRPGPLLGLSVAVMPGRVVFLSLDRPRQFARSMRRMVAESDRAAMNERVAVWAGPLPTSPLASKDVLADHVQAVAPDAAVVFVDSVKDLAPGISKDEVGASLNSAFQELIARGVDLVTVHHGRKATSGERRGRSLDDVYGSTWLTAGHGSVLVFDGDPGDATVELHHVKQPAEAVGPLTVRHDHVTGTSTLHTGGDLLSALRAAGPRGLTAVEAATQVLGRDAPADVKRIKRQVAALGATVCQVPGTRTAQGATPTRYFVSPAVEGWVVE